MAWLWLGLAGLLEIVWAFSMKQSEAFTRWLPTAIMVVGMVASFGFLSLALKSLPLGTAYTVWSGIGALGAFVVGVVVLGEPLNELRMLAAALVLVGVVLLKLSA